MTGYVPIQVDFNNCGEAHGLNLNVNSGFEPLGLWALGPKDECELRAESRNTEVGGATEANSPERKPGHSANLNPSPARIEWKYVVLLPRVKTNLFDVPGPLIGLEPKMEIWAEKLVVSQNELARPPKLMVPYPMEINQPLIWWDGLVPEIFFVALATA
ncbi:hypothetical protein K438DRAFT_1767297 [Mycena galopus ATCC 62051]|nr:hypothetical protein K438DRAFT_1767297 [Mycena galopus ATCC 62051]